MQDQRRLSCAWLRARQKIERRRLARRYQAPRYPLRSNAIRLSPAPRKSLVSVVEFCDSGSVVRGPTRQREPPASNTLTDTTGIEIPKPLDWQDFQRKSVVLFRCLIEDARLQEWGLGGQLQNGIDLLGCRNENPNRPVGVQCRRIETQLTPTKMRTDVEEARAIQPPLVEFIFATTAKRDRKIQQEALSITQELIKSGWTCRVVVMAWEDLQLEVARHPLALKAFFPQAYPDSATRHDVDAAVDRGTGVIKRDLHQQTTTLLERLDEFRDSRKIVAASYDPDLDPDAAAEPAALHTRITVLRELINNGRTRTAIKQLQTLLAQDGTLPPYARYRVIANIGAAHFYADRPKNAHESFSIALALRPDDPKAQVNMAYAELSLGQCAEAISIAKRILAQQPSNASAASILIQALKDNQSVTDPFALVPAAARGHAEVVSAAIIFLRRRNDISWFKVAADAAMAHPANVMLRQFAAEAVIQPIVADQEILLGKPIDPSVFQRVSAAADQLHAIWQDYVNTEEVTSDSIVPLAHNCAIALRFCDRSETAARLLDRTIETVGLDPELVRTRVLLHLHADEESQALALIGSEPDEPALALMAAEITTSNDPAAAMERLGRIRVGDLPCELQPVAHELAAQLAISLNAKPEFDAAMQRLTLSQHSTTTVRLLQARAVKAGLVSHPASSTAATNEVASHPQSIDEDEDIDDDDDTGLALPPSPELAPFVEHVIDQDAALTFVERIQAAVYLEHHGACEVASDLLHGRVALDRDTIGLRTYLAASVGANLTARAESILGSIPEPLLDLPHYLRAAATLYWNIGDARRAAPMIARLSDASPQRLDLLLWHIDALLRLDDNKTIRKLLAAPVETTVTGSVKQCARLVRALATFGQPERGLAVAYRQLAKNRDDPAAWLSFMSMILGPRDEAADSLLSQTVSGDYAIEIVDPDGVIRRFVIEVDDVVQKLERDAIPPTHPIALAVQGLKPGDTFLWPRTNASATVKSVKHKYLDAFHATLAQFNERFPTAKGFQQIKVHLPVLRISIN